VEIVTIKEMDSFEESWNEWLYSDMSMRKKTKRLGMLGLTSI
jgi:hypothetical protein